VDNPGGRVASRTSSKEADCTATAGGTEVLLVVDVVVVAVLFVVDEA